MPSAAPMENERTNGLALCVCVCVVAATRRSLMSRTMYGTNNVRNVPRSAPLSGKWNHVHATASRIRLPLPFMAPPPPGGTPAPSIPCVTASPCGLPNACWVADTSRIRFPFLRELLRSAANPSPIGRRYVTAALIGGAASSPASTHTHLTPPA